MHCKSCWLHQILIVILSQFFFFHIENKIKKRENSKFQILDFFVNIHIHKLNPTIQKEDIYTIIKEFVVTLCVQ